MSQPLRYKEASFVVRVYRWIRWVPLHYWKALYHIIWWIAKGRPDEEKQTFWTNVKLFFDIYRGMADIRMNNTITQEELKEKCGDDS